MFQYNANFHDQLHVYICLATDVHYLNIPLQLTAMFTFIKKIKIKIFSFLLFTQNIFSLWVFVRTDAIEMKP